MFACFQVHEHQTRNREQLQQCHRRADGQERWLVYGVLHDGGPHHRHLLKKNGGGLLYSGGKSDDSDDWQPVTLTAVLQLRAVDRLAIMVPNIMNIASASSSDRPMFSVALLQATE